jgi:chemotaxis protein MotB
VVEHENEERWLLTYADMITLLMALFMVLFSIASVNKSKLDVLTKALQEAFSGKILPGGTNIQQSGAQANAHDMPTATPPIPAIQPLISKVTSSEGAAASSTGSATSSAEQESFKHLKQQIDDYARAHHLQHQVQTVIARRGLVIRLLTDKVLFNSGQADLKPPAGPELTQIAKLLQLDKTHQVTVEGHTDNFPIHGLYPTNWELSTARASRVVRFLIEHGVAKGRLAATGYAALHPIASNGTEAGRSRNRRVEIVLLRSGQGPATQGGDMP